MNYRKLALLSFLVLSLAVFFTFALNAGDKSSKAVNGTVVCIDKGGKECCADESSASCCSESSKKCTEHKLGLKTSDGKVYPFAADAKFCEKTLNESIGKTVEVSGYICPVSKTVHSTSVKLIELKNEGSCSQSKERAKKTTGDI